MLCDRPERLTRNAAGQLHNADGPALVYRNGWCMYALDGVRVDPVAVLPREQITFELIESQPRYKKMLVERYGRARYRAERAAHRIQPAPVLNVELPSQRRSELSFCGSSRLMGNCLCRVVHNGRPRDGLGRTARIGKRVRSVEFAADALAVAYATMDRAKHNVLLLQQRLVDLQYVFRSFGYEAASPKSRADSRLVEREFGILPLSLRAWWDVVGGVDFMGEHPLLSIRSVRESAALGTLLTDPLIVYGPAVTVADFECSIPEAILAPDRFHKHDISGGEPYGIGLPSPTADAVVLHAESELPFVEYLRRCFHYGGFPGFYDDESKIPAREMAMLTEGLLAI